MSLVVLLFGGDAVIRLTKLIKKNNAKKEVLKIAYFDFVVNRIL